MKRKELLYISICIFLTMIAWLVADLYHTASQSRLTNDINEPALIEYRIEPDLIKLIEDKKER